MNQLETSTSSILGFSDEVDTYLKNIDPEYKNHRKEVDWIRNYIHMRRKTLDYEKPTKDQLLYLGFKETQARILASQIDLNEYSSHRTTLQWVQDYISLQFKYNTQLGGIEAPPYHPENRTGERDLSFHI